MKKTTRSIAALFMLGAPLVNADVDALETQVQELQVALDKMRQEINKSGGGLYGNTRFTVDGYVKVDAIYDLNQNMGSIVWVPNLDVSQDDKPEFSSHIQQSRINFNTYTDTPIGEANLRLELDLFGSKGVETYDNEHNLGVRHGYIEIGPYLVGQTWSNFMQLTGVPRTVDFGGPVGISFVRQPQLRYTTNVGVGALAFSVENAETTGFENSEDSLPDVTTRYYGTLDSGLTLETSALVRYLKTGDNVKRDSTVGYGLAFAFKQDLAERYAVQGGIIYGQGIGRYIMETESNNASDLTRTGVGAAYLSSEGIEKIEAGAATAGVSAQWNKSFYSGLTLSVVKSNQPGDLFPSATEYMKTAHFSHFYTPFSPATIGLEVSYAEKTQFDSRKADNIRLQASFQYDF